ncbi:hypothetical protein L195_g023006 [Trifolium pratense]|uniref:Uncharacterized protein n=1 Tax=Trifolium pratense TaxID=57577 RepID=A0A2K3N9K7_TRIPR|nr:hypothetical protein L195_g023006 [Trifolium pratense]
MKPSLRKSYDDYERNYSGGRSYNKEEQGRRRVTLQHPDFH